METFRWILLVIILFVTELLWVCWGLSVKILYKKPIYVALNRTLVIQAQYDLQPLEKIIQYTWELKKGPQVVRLVTNGYLTFDRLSVENNGQTLKLTGVTEVDYGIYKFTVTDGNGDQWSDSGEVLKPDTPPGASFDLECSTNIERPPWDKPVYLWWVDGVKVTSGTGNLSEDGSKLHLRADLKTNYTCVIDSNQGSSKIERFREPEQDQKTCSDCTGWIAVVVIETIVIVILIGYKLLMWIRHKKKKTTTSE